MSTQSDDKPNPDAQILKDFSPWIKAIAVVAFDVEHGQIVEMAYPDNALSSDIKKKICCLALPDSNSGQNGDVQFSFRLRTGNISLNSISPLEQEFLFASVFFRQIRDPSLARGYFQKSVVLISHHPYNNFLHECARVFGPLYFEFGEDVLDAVSTDVRSWKNPVPGIAYELPLAGTIIYYRVPVTGLKTEDQFRTKSGASKPDPDSVIRVVKRKDSVRSTGSSTSAPEAQGSLSSTVDDLLIEGVCAVSGDELSGAEEDIADPHNEAEASIQRIIKSQSSRDLARAKNGVNGASAESLSEALNNTTAVGGDGVNPSPSFQFSTEPHKISLGDLFDTKSQECPGLFQDVRLFSTFGGLSVSLWHIWELAICGEPILVLAPTPDSCSQAVMAIASLTAPMLYNGDYRPYFTIYDPDFEEIRKRHDQLRGQQMPACVVGVTNPYFLKTFEYWPNVLAMGGTGPTPQALGSVAKPGSNPASGSHQHIRRRHEYVASPSIDESSSVQGSSIRSAQYHPKIAKRGASLDALLTTQEYERSLILTRDEPLVSPDKNVLKYLVIHKQSDEDHKAAAAAAAAGVQWEPPAVSMNNAILRQHFRDLTNAFLRPLDRYFKLASVGSRAARVQGISLSAYNEPARLFELFDEEAFMQMLETQYPAKMLQRTKWRSLYRKFINGPNFWPWFNQKRLQLANQLSIIYRHLRLHTDSETLINTVTRGNTRGSARKQSETSCVHLYFKVKNALDLELAKPVEYRDTDLCNKMQEHLAAVQALLHNSETLSNALEGTSREEAQA